MEEMENKTRTELLEEEWRETIRELSMFREDHEGTKCNLARLKELNEQMMALRKAELEEAQKLAELELAQQKARAEEIARNQQLELEAQKQKDANRSNVVNWIIGGVTALTGVLGVSLGYKSWKSTMIAEYDGHPPMSKAAGFVKSQYGLFRK